MAQLSEQEREKVRKQAQEILENFSKVLQKVKIQKKEFKKNEGGSREEGVGSGGESSFREIMFDNAPFKNKDNIIAEKKKW
ncbi:MAG: hypothetical protein Q8Q31_02585 [Nanoarchaeota archaeon]|nr:hypothetical protein [Nanoarchaeota archaeon]